MTFKKIATTLIKITISSLLLIYLFSKIDLSEVWQLLQQVHVAYLIAAVGLYLTGQAVCAYRWKILAILMDFNNRFREFLVYYFIGMFFSLFLPTLIGGDVGKCYYLARRSKKTLHAVISILADRGSGLVALFLISGISVSIVNDFDIPSEWKWAILSANVAMVIGFIAPFFLGDLFSRLGGSTVSLALIYWKQPFYLLRAVSVSFIFQGTIILIHILIGTALGLDIPWKYYFFLIPLVTTISMLPVSFSGLGVREGAYVYFLSLVNVPQTEALTFAVGWFIVVLVSSLIGGIPLLTNNVAIQKAGVHGHISTAIQASQEKSEINS